MKKLSLLIIPISLLFLGVFVCTGTKDVEAAYGDRADYKLDPWTFWQAGASTDGWNPWELSAFEYVYVPNDCDKYSDSTPDDPDAHPRIYGRYRGPGKYYEEDKWYNDNWFKHGDPGNMPSNDEREAQLQHVSHGYIAKIEGNGWSGKWVPSEEELQTNNDPPKWGEPSTEPQETTSFIPYLMDNNPYTVRTWTKARGLKKNRTYTWVFDAYIDDDCKYADPTWDSEEHDGKPAPQVSADTKYCKIVGKNGSGKILFVRYIEITKNKQRYMFNFDMDSSNNELNVEYMYGSFLLTGPIIKHKEVVWSGTVHLENADIIQGNLLKEEETTTTRRAGGGSAADWGDTPEKVTGVKVKNKAKKSVILSWKSAEYADKYQYNYALKKNFKGGKKKYTTKKKITIKKLKRKKVYWFRVRGVSEDYGNGPWSAKKKIKTK